MLIRRSTLFVILVFFMCQGILAQIPIAKNDLLLQGYKDKVVGIDFNYESTLPGINESMLIRATDGKQYMIWETETVPSDLKNNYVSFTWLAGFGCNLGEAGLELEINETYKIPFTIDKSLGWKSDGPENIELYYRHNRFDGVGDKYGFMFLRVPKKLLTPGKSIKLKVTAGRNNSQSWYMTFKAPLKPGMVFKAFPALIKGEKNTQPIALSVYHFSQDETAKIYANETLFDEVELAFGHNYFTYEWPEVSKEEKVIFRLETSAYKEDQEVNIKPPRKWQVNFVMHSHTDIGYTRPQTEILAEHLRYIDYALDYCDATDNYPEDAKFRWTCEAAWAVDEYLKSRPMAQIERLKKRVQEGRIEITGMYFNFDELPDEQTLAASLAPIKRFHEHGLDVKLAMQNDVNGTGWCFNDYFNPLGIKYLDMGTHGHRALISFDIPTAFWWESPSGNRMLGYRAEHYMYGNTVFGIHTMNFHYFEEKLMSYLEDLGGKGYPYDLIAIQHSGYLTDNAPPSTLSCEMIKMWNEKYEWPKLRQAAAREFFEVMEKDHADALPVYRVAWPDWWTDGFGSAAREVAATRSAHSHIIANQGALSMAALLGSPLPEGIEDRIFETNKSILFYGEHTMGSSESVRDPYGTATMEQREMKESFAWEANRRARMIGEEALGLLQNFFSKDKLPSLLVFNTLGWERDGLVQIYIDHQILPLGKKFRILDSEGNPVPAQQMGHRSDGTYWGIWTENVPAFGVKKLLIEVEKEDLPAQNTIDEVIVSQTENQWYRVTIDHKKGSIPSLFDKELNLELVDQDAQWKLGEFINELLDNRSQIESFTLNNYQRIGLDTIWYDGFVEGPIWNTVRFKGETETFFSPNGYEVEFRIYNTTKRIDLAYTIVKKPILAPEGIYLSFPFELEGAKIFSEVPGGVMEAGVDQLPGSSSDWNTLQYFAAVRSKSAQVIFGSQEVPLVQFGAINMGRFETDAKPESNHIFSWPMNNYWTTNFNADQRGGHEWTYYITSSANTSNSFATRFGWGARIPFPARVLPAGNGSKETAIGGFIKGFPENLLLVNVKPNEKGNSLILQFRELDGIQTKLKLTDSSGKPLTLKKVNVIGEALEGKAGDLDIGAFENAFVKVSW